VSRRGERRRGWSRRPRALSPPRWTACPGSAVARVGWLRWAVGARLWTWQPLRTVEWLRVRYRSLPRLSTTWVRLALDAGPSHWVTLIRAIGRGVIGNTFAFGANVPGSSPGGRAGQTRRPEALTYRPCQGLCSVYGDHFSHSSHISRSERRRGLCSSPPAARQIRACTRP